MAIAKKGSSKAASKTKRGAAVAKAAAKRGAKAAVSGAVGKRGRKPAETEFGDVGAPSGSTSLVIVESPAKAKTIGKYLGRGYRVKATVGHIMDLPEKKLGIDVENGFAADLVPIPGKERTIAELRDAAKDSREIFIATDPDREGEAIANHVATQVRRKNGAPIRRVLFHEITKDAVQKAIAQAGDIDEKKVEAQQARRVLDRLVGYKASPILWKTVKKGLSAGRVQTVALRLIVEREREIRAFKPVEYWTIEAQLEKNGQKFVAKLHHVDGHKPEIGSEAAATKILREVQAYAAGVLRESDGKRVAGAGDLAGMFPVTDVKRRERRKNPAAPFTTSTLQQEAAKKLGFGSKRTMRVAQDLYEGIEVGAEGQVGLITYMRTDSTRVAESAAQQAQDYLRTLFGREFVASGLQLYGKATTANTQDAHEGVRPTDPTRRPDAIKRYLKDDQFKLYELIWKRFMASQMTPAVFDTTTLDYALDAQHAPKGLPQSMGEYLFRSTGSVIKFQGFLALYKEAREEGESKALEDEQALPSVELGERVPVRSITPDQHFTEPPPRFSEASLVKELERLGIGRPSTYASIISVLADRRYVLLEQRRFFPTELGESVEKVMVRQFPDIFNVAFTSEMEEELDKVEGGSLGWQKVLKDFYKPFDKSLKSVQVEQLIGEAYDLSKIGELRCPDCGGKLEPRGGFFGPFLACENHPKTCKYTRPISGEKKKAELTEYKCHICGEPMVKREGRSGAFLGCSTFPKCRGTRSMPTGVMCPKDGGELVERKSKKRGTNFYACSNEDCDFVAWNKPVAEVCPECGYNGAEVKFNKTRGEFRKCLKCGNEWDVAQKEEEVVEVA
jgi:DNA topoisomerase-1